MIPCHKCILLALCKNKDTIDCELLKIYMNQYKDCKENRITAWNQILEYLPKCHFLKKDDITYYTYRCYDYELKPM